jgi:hypothetical protein
MDRLGAGLIRAADLIPGEVLHAAQQAIDTLSARFADATRTSEHPHVVGTLARLRQASSSIAQAINDGRHAVDGLARYADQIGTPAVRRTLPAPASAPTLPDPPTSHPTRQGSMPPRHGDAFNDRAGTPDQPETTLLGAHSDQLLRPLDNEQRQRFDAYRHQLSTDGKTRPVDDTGPEYDYQRRWCGSTEYRISPDEDLPRAAWADGLNSDLGLAQDAKYVREDARSWFRPESLPPVMRTLAIQKMDDRLLKYREAIRDGGSPVRGLEIVVNSRSAAEFVAGRMNTLGVPGIVRIRQ